MSLSVHDGIEYCASLLESGSSETAVQICLGVATTLLNSARVSHHHRHAEGLLPFTLLLLLLQALPHQVHTRELVAMSTATHSHAGQGRK